MPGVKAIDNIVGNMDDKGPTFTSTGSRSILRAKLRVKGSLIFCTSLGRNEGNPSEIEARRLHILVDNAVVADEDTAVRAMVSTVEKRTTAMLLSGISLVTVVRTQKEEREERTYVDRL